jgi:chromosome segregation ATPase
MSDSTISVDEFQALEQKVLRAVEIVRHEREARAAAEAEAASLRALLDQQSAEFNDLRAKLHTLTQERDGVRLRVERMLRQMDELV